MEVQEDVIVENVASLFNASSPTKDNSIYNGIAENEIPQHTFRSQKVQTRRIGNKIKFDRTFDAVPTSKTALPEMDKTDDFFTYNPRKEEIQNVSAHSIQKKENSFRYFCG